MLYTEDLKTKLFKDKNNKKYTPASLYLGSKKTGGYSILEPSQKEIEIFNGYNDSAFIKINGESNQVTSNAGKNLLDPAKILTGYNSSGTTVDSTTIISGSAYNLIQSYLIKLTPSTSYRLSKELAGTRFRGFYFETYPIGTGAVSIGGIYRDAFTEMSISFPATARWFFVVLTGDYEAKPTGNVQLEQGTSITTFAEFVPNRPSPDYPSNINSPSNFDLISRAKNLFNYQNMVIAQTTREDDLISMNPSVYDRIMNKTQWTPKPSTNYTIVLDIVENSFTNAFVLRADNRFYFETFSTSIPIRFTGRKVFNVTTRADFSAVTLGSLWFFGSNANTGVFKCRIMILEGTHNEITAGAYQKYITPSSVNFPYTLNRFTDGTKDYIEIDNINKTAKLYKFVGEFAFLDSMSYTLYTYNGLLGAFATVLPENYVRVAGVCTHEKRVGTFYTTTGTYMWIGVGSKQVFWIGILDALNITTVGEFKTWLGQQTANGNTVKGIYKLKTPTVTDLNYDEVTTYYPYTKIYTNATVQPTLDGKIRVQGENKSALDLTTTDAQISMGNAAALRLRNNFTVACFIKSTIIPTSNQYFLRRCDVGISGICWGMIRTSTRPAPQNKGLSVLVSNSGTVGYYVYGTGNIDTTDGKWHHMAFTYSNKTVKLYVDGILDATETVNSLTSNDLTDTASAFDSANSYNGLLDDIRYYSRVLTDDEILKLSKGLKVSDTNMVGHWKCNEGKGTTVKNETNIANTDGVLNAQAKWTNDTIYQ